jgi:hypothetical protein
MENRIEINGVWYVREDAITDPLDHLEAEEMDLTFSEECCFESNKYCFVASRIKSMITVKNFTKTFMLNSQIKEVVDRDTWKEDYWDNNLLVQRNTRKKSRINKFF